MVERRRRRRRWGDGAVSGAETTVGPFSVAAKDSGWNDDTMNEVALVLGGAEQVHYLEADLVVQSQGRRVAGGPFHWVRLLEQLLVVKWMVVD